MPPNLGVAAPSPPLLHAKLMWVGNLTACRTTTLNTDIAIDVIEIGLCADLVGCRSVTGRLPTHANEDHLDRSHTPQSKNRIRAYRAIQIEIHDFACILPSTKL